MKIYTTIKEASFTAKSKESGKVVNFASQQNRDNAIKSGEYEETDSAGGEPAAAKPKVNIFDKPTPQANPSSDGDSGSKPSSMVAPAVVKTPVDVLKSKVEKWSEKEKAFFRDGVHKQDSPERRNWKDAIKDKAKGAIAAIKKGAKHEVEEFKAAGAGVKNFFSGKELSEHEKKALKAVAIKVATTAIFGAVTGGAGHGVLAFGKHVAMEFIPHIVGETILKGAGTAALFAGDEDEDINMERFMAIIADKMANEKITPELMTQMVDSYNAKKVEGDSVNEEITELTPDQSEMVQGIIDMLLQIKDTDNRMEVAQQQIQNFKDEEIIFNYAWFLSAAGLDNNDEPVRMDVKTQPQHIINKESIMIGKINEDFKHIIHVDTPTQVVSKPIAAQILALAKKGIRSKDIGLEMGFVGNAKLATDTFQKVKNKIYFELGNKNESVNEASKRAIDFYNDSKHGKAIDLLLKGKWDSKKVENFLEKLGGGNDVKYARIIDFISGDVGLNIRKYKNIGEQLPDLMKQLEVLYKDFLTESVNEAKYIQPKDDWGVRLVVAINNNVKGLHTSVIREKRDVKESVDAFGTMLKNAIRETLKHKYKPHPKAKDADIKIKTFISELKKFENIVDMVIAKPTKIGVTKLDDAWRSIWNHKYAAEIALAGELFNSLIEGNINEGNLSDTWRKNNKKGYTLKVGNIELKSAGPSNTHDIYKNGYLWGKFHMDYESGGTDWWVEPSKGNDFWVKEVDDIVKRVKVDSRFNESINEVASRTAMEIGALTGTNKDFIQSFVDKHNLDIEKVFQYVKKGKLKDRMDFVTAVVGKDNNPYQTKLIKQFKESVNEAFNIKDLPGYIFDDPIDFNEWWEDGMELKKGRISPFNKSDDQYLARLVKAWMDAEDDYSDGRGDLGTGKQGAARAASYKAQDSIKQFLNKKSKVSNESVNEAPQKVGNVNAFGASKVLGKGKKVLGFVADTPNAVATLIQDFPQAMEIEFKQGFFSDGKLLKSIKKGDKVWKELEKRYLDKQTKDAMKAGFSINEERILVRKVMGDDAEKFLKKYPKVKQVMSVIAKKNTDLMKGYKAFLKFKDAQEDYLGGRAEVSSSPTFGSKTFYKYDWGNLKNHWPEVYQYIYTLHFGGLDGATVEGINEAMGNDKSMLALADVLSNSMEHYDEGDFLQSVRGGQGWSGIAGFQNSGLIQVFKSIYKKYWTVSPQNRTNWTLKDWIKWLKPFGLEENWDSEMEPVEESTPGEQIQNLNNRIIKLRQEMAKAKSPEAKNVIQARMKNALQSLSNKKKDMGIQKP